MPQKSKLDLPPIDLGKETLGERLSRLRKQKGLSQSDLAKEIGIIQELVSAFELNKRKLSAEMVARFAKALGVSCDIIIGYKSNGSKKMNLNLRLMKRLHKIEKLSEYKQKKIISVIDSLLRDAETKEKY